MVAACRVVYDEADRDIHEKSACIRMTPAAEILADVKDDPVDPATSSAPSRRGASVLPSAFADTLLRGGPPPSPRKRSMRMPSAGMPCAVSRTWVLSLPIFTPSRPFP